MKILEEKFLTTYFTCSKILQAGESDKKYLFDGLFNSFLLPQSDRQKLFNLIQDENVTEITTHTTYLRFRREMQHATLINMPYEISDDLNDILMIKGATLKHLEELGLKENLLTKEAIRTLIHKKASEGVIPFVMLLGFLQCEGIFMDKDLHSGLKNLEKGCNWNSEESMLIMLHYETENRNSILDKLFTVTQGTNSEDIYNIAKNTYDKKHVPQKSFENNLLRKVFNDTDNPLKLNPQQFSGKMSRIVYGNLSEKDKESALFSEHPEIVQQLADLPLKFKNGEITYSPIASNSLIKENETQQINRILSRSHMRCTKNYRPLCIVSDSEYVARYAMDMLAGCFNDANVEVINFATLTEQNVIGTKNNIFVRSCVEDKQNIYLFDMLGGVDINRINIVKNFMSTENRRKFTLAQPSVSLDLSPVLSVCFTDSENAKLLSGQCDIVVLPTIKEDEKTKIIEFILKEKAKTYAVKKITIDSDALDTLKAYSIDNIESTLDRTVRFNCDSGVKTFNITNDLLKQSLPKSSPLKIQGFGGNDR